MISRFQILLQSQLAPLHQGLPGSDDNLRGVHRVDDGVRARAERPGHRQVRGAPAQEKVGRGLHSSTFQLTLSSFRNFQTGAARRIPQKSVYC